jgi:hypothetical protein
MTLRRDTRKARVGNELEVMETQLNGALSRITSTINTMQNIKTTTQNSADFTAEERQEVIDMITELRETVWAYAVDNIPQPIKDAYPA